MTTLRLFLILYVRRVEEGTVIVVAEADSPVTELLKTFDLLWLGHGLPKMNETLEEIDRTSLHTQYIDIHGNVQSNQEPELYHEASGQVFRLVRKPDALDQLELVTQI